MRAATVLVTALLLASPAVAVPGIPPPRCTRVHPGPVFTFPKLAPATANNWSEDSLAIVVDDASGRRLVAVGHDDVQRWSVVLRVYGPDGAGGLQFLSEARPLVPGSPDRWPDRTDHGDFDGDGNVDVVTEAYAREIVLYRGGGDGGFLPGFQVGSYDGTYPVLGDFDADGRTEMLSGNRLHEYDAQGALVVRTIAGVPPWSGEFVGLVSADIDGDGDEEVIGRTGTRRIAVLQGDPHDPLSHSETVELAFDPWRLYAQRLGGTRGEAVLAFERNGEADRVHRLAGAGPGEAWSLDVKRNVGPGGLADFDGDGVDDLHSHPDMNTATIHWGLPDAPFEVPGVPIASRANPIGCLDLNGDGLQDLLLERTWGPIGLWVELGITALRAVGVRAYEPGLLVTRLQQGLGWDQPLLHTAVSDLDGDGLDDVIAQTWYPDSNSLAFARGDGSFTVQPLEAGEFDPRVDAADIDADGTPDLWAESWDPETGVPCLAVAWGRGDRSFTPWERFTPPAAGPIASRSFTLGRLDRSPGLDLLVADWATGSGSEMRFQIALFANRSWSTVDSFTVDPAEGIAYQLADVDADGMDDLLYSRPEPGWGPQRLFVRLALEPLGFGPERPILDEGLPCTSVRTQVVDFDLDGTADVFAAAHQCDQPTDDVSLRGRGDGTFEVMARTPPAKIDGQDVDRLIVDLDGDGRPDAIEAPVLDFEWENLSGLFVVRRGDGLGGFFTPEGPPWLTPIGPSGVFRRLGVRDMARVFAYPSRPFPVSGVDLEISPSTGHILDYDVAPPVVELRALPIPGAPASDTWRLATLPIDECSSAPRVTERVVEFLPLDDGTPLSFAASDTVETLVYEIPATGRRGVVLHGPNLDAARTAFHEARRAGGYRFQHLAPLRLIVSDEYGPAMPAVPGVRLVQRIVVRDGAVVEVAVTRPGADITFRLTATDGVHTGTTTASFLAVRPAPD